MNVDWGVNGREHGGDLRKWVKIHNILALKKKKKKLGFSYLEKFFCTVNRMLDSNSKKIIGRKHEGKFMADRKVLYLIWDDDCVGASTGKNSSVICIRSVHFILCNFFFLNNKAQYRFLGNSRN